jgi:hypothetical protein
LLDFEAASKKPRTARLFCQTPGLSEAMLSKPGLQAHSLLVAQA